MCVPKETRLELEIGWFLDHLSAERGASPHTVAAYDRDLKQIGGWLVNYNVGSFKEVDGDASALVRSKLSSYSPSTIQRKLSALRSMIKFLARRSGSAPDNLPSTGGFRKPRTLPKALTDDEMQRLADAPDLSGPEGLRDRAMIELLYGGGLRVSELVGLCLEDYVESESLLRVTGKREKVRLVPLPLGTHEHLRRYIQQGREHLRKPATRSQVFLNNRGGALSRSGVFKMLRRYAAVAGIEKEIGPHTLRHTYAVHLVKNGADLRSVQELLGHANIVTTEVYTLLDLDTVIEKYQDAHPRARKRA
jgi:integrase/recombinase XerD